MKVKATLMLCILVFPVLFIAGCGNEINSEANCPRLALTVVCNGDYVTSATSDTITSKQHVIYLQNISKVNILTRDGEICLSDALQKDIITPYEIVAYAKIDASNGVCSMEYQSRCGYSQYVYHYDQFDLISIYDIFEAPDGAMYHSEKLTIAAPGLYNMSKIVEFPEEKRNGTWIELAREDWGVSFNVTEVSDRALTIQCSQNGGQQIGKLKLANGFTIYKVCPDGRLEYYFSHHNIFIPDKDSYIIDNGVSQFSISWPPKCKKPPVGNYILEISLNDIYDNIPSLIRNYTDQQSYQIPFTVTE